MQAYFIVTSLSGVSAVVSYENGTRCLKHRSAALPRMTATNPTGATSDNSTPLTEAEQNALRYTRRHEPVTRDELADQSQLPLQRVDRILATLERHDIADVHVGWTRTTIRTTGGKR